MPDETNTHRIAISIPRETYDGIRSLILQRAAQDKTAPDSFSAWVRSKAQEDIRRSKKGKHGL